MNEEEYAEDCIFVFFVVAAISVAVAVVVILVQLTQAHPACELVSPSFSDARQGRIHTVVDGNAAAAAACV